MKQTKRIAQLPIPGRVQTYILHYMQFQHFGSTLAGLDCKGVYLNASTARWSFDIHNRTCLLFASVLLVCIAGNQKLMYVCMCFCQSLRPRLSWATQHVYTRQLLLWIPVRYRRSYSKKQSELSYDNNTRLKLRPLYLSQSAKRNTPRNENRTKVPKQILYS